jgi:hypothetical protein
MLLRTTASLTFAAACLTAIATIPTHAQTAGTYGSAPGYSGPPGYNGPQPAYGSAPGYSSPPAVYGSTPGYNAPPAAYSATRGYNSSQSNALQASQGDVGQSASARRNVVESRQYDRALETNRGFRQARMRKECGPISDPELRQSCLASFHQDEPSMGSSSSSRAQLSDSGR